MNRRSCLNTVLGAGLGLLTSRAHADTPPPTTTLVVGFPPGGPIDHVARLLAPALGEALQGQVVVESHSGASGAIATAAVARAAGTRSTLLLAPGSAFTVQPHLQPADAAEPVRSLLPMAMIGASPLAIVVAANHPARTLPELMDWFARHPAQAFCGDAGIATIAHLTTIELSRTTGVPLTSVHYRGVAEELAALAEGSLKAAVLVPGAVVPLRDAGHVRILATTGRQRASIVGDVPTLRESRVDVVASEWAGLFAPASTSSSQAQRLSQAAERALDDATVRARLENFGLSRETRTMADFLALVQRERAHWGKIVSASGIVAGS